MIFYFSGTGNSRWVAAQLAGALGDTLCDMAAELRRATCNEAATAGVTAAQPSPLSYTLAEGECLGFCFPTHGWQPPRLVRDFIRRAQFRVQPSTYCFAVTTCGDNMGEAMTILNQELQAKGLEAETQFSVIMPESYVCLPFMHTDSDERVAEKIAQAERQLAHIGSVVRSHQRGIMELEKGATPRLYSYIIGGFFIRKMITDRKFTVDADVCTRCGRCEKVCPVGNVQGAPPSWRHDGSCTMCLACYHHCPVHAINYGAITRRRGQYYFGKQGSRNKK